MEKTEQDILLEGIIKYTESGKLVWKVLHQGEFTTDYSSHIKITNLKFVNLTFFNNFKDKTMSVINVTISKESNTVIVKDKSSFNKKYATISVDSNARLFLFDELYREIKKKLEK